MSSKLQRLADELRGSSDWRVRRRAARKLGGAGEKKWAAALLEALDDLDPDVVAGAIDGLLKLGEKAATGKLVKPKVIGSADPVVRWCALQALGTLGGDEIVEPTVKLLDDSEWVVRNEARAILSQRIGAMASSPKVEKLPLLVRLLSIKDAEVRQAVVAALAGFGLQATDTMVQALQLPSVQVREGAARALGRIRDPSSVPALSAVCRDDDPSVRRAAAWALGAIVGERAAVEALTTLLADSSRAVAEEAQNALVRIGKPAVGHLVRSLRRVRGKTARRNIVRVLGRLRDDRALPALLDHLGDSTFLVRDAAIDAVIGFGEPVVPMLTEMLEPSKVPTELLLKEATTASSKRVRLRGIRALGELRDHSAVDSLKRLAEDADADVAAAAERSLALIGCAAWGRACAAVALGRLRARRAVRPLVRALRDPSHDVRGASTRALGEIGGWRFFRALGSVLVSDTDAEVRAEAALVLQRAGRRGKMCAEAAVKAMADPSRVVRSRAAKALGRYQNPVAVPALAQGLADRSWSVRRDCENALANLGAAAVPGLLRCLTEADEEAGQRILTILGRIAPKDLRRKLRSKLSRIKTPALRERVEGFVATLTRPRGHSTPPASR